MMLVVFPVSLSLSEPRNIIHISGTGTGETLVICVISSLSAIMCLISTKTSSIWMSYVSNTIALSSYSALYALACVSISIRLNGDARRYALVFTANSFVALAIATVLSKTGSSLKWDTNKFYYVAFAASCAATLIPPLVLFYMRFFSTHDDDEMRESILTRRGESELSVVAGDDDDDDDEEEDDKGLTRRKSSGCSV